MRATFLRARSELSSGWKALVALVLILGVSGGVVLFAVAGARRTDTAYQRLVTWVHGPDAIVSGGGFGFSHVDLGRVARLPEVTASAPVDLTAFYPTTTANQLTAIGDGGGTAPTSV